MTGSSFFYSEDLNDGQVYCGVRAKRDVGGKLVYQSGSTWYRCDNPSSTWQVTAPYTPIADACERQPGRRIAMDARYDSEDSGLVLIVR